MQSRDRRFKSLKVLDLLKFYISSVVNLSSMFFAVKLEKLTPSCAAWSKQAHMSRMGEHDAQEGLKKTDARQLVNDN